MRKKLSLAFLLLLVAGSLLQAAPRLRVVIMSDFPPVDVVPGGMGLAPPTAGATRTTYSRWSASCSTPTNST